MLFWENVVEVAAGHKGSTPRLRMAPQTLRSYPCPLVR